MSWKRLIRHVARWLTGFRNRPSAGDSSSHLPTESVDSEALPNRTPPTDAFMPGQVLDNRFRFVRFMARGGRGEVYAADDLRGGGQVALKTIRPPRASHPDMLERFRREVENAKQVTSRHVCRVHDLHHHRPDHSVKPASGPPEEVAFLTMELLPGPTLSEIIRRDGRMAPEQALSIVRQIVAGVDAAHSVGIIHRDLKSSNIILAPGPVPGGPPLAKITDFGLARRLPQEGETESSFTRAGPIGTPEYMAPEVRLSARSATKTSDIYSLGVVLYQMVTGRLPEPGKGQDGGGIQPPSRFAPGLPKKWDEAILRCLNPDPSRRFRNALDILSALEGTTCVAPFCASPP